MTHTIKTLCSLAVVGSAAAQTSEVLVGDDFSLSVVTAGARFTDTDIDSGNWVVRGDANNADGPAWEVVDEQLTNPASGSERNE